MTSLALLIIVITGSEAALNSYNKCKTFRVNISNMTELEALAQFYEKPGFDFWTRSPTIHHSTDIMVFSDEVENFEEFLNSNNLSYRIIIDDVDELVESERLIFPTEYNSTSIGFDIYYRFDEINAYLDHLAAEYPDLVKVQSIGTSFEGRDMKLLTLSTGDNGKPAIFIDAGIHAREWISISFVLYVMNQLVEHHDKNRALIENVDWYFLPVMNPDGYEYSHTNERLWRKTRSTTASTTCPGTDGNRNFDFHWLEIGASKDPCSSTFAGAHAFSEPETAAVSNFILQNSDKIKFYLTFHSYGQYFLYPWGYTTNQPTDWKDLHDLAIAATDAIQAVAGTRYTVGSSSIALYPAAGGSDDWSKAVAGIKYSYTIELPGGGRLGFDPPTSSIQSIVEETFEGIRMYALSEIVSCVLYIMYELLEHFPLVIFLTMTAFMVMQIEVPKESDTLPEDLDHTTLLEINSKIGDVKEYLNFLKNHKRDLNNLYDEVEKLSASYNNLEKMIKRCKTNISYVANKLSVVKSQMKLHSACGDAGMDAAFIPCN